MNTDVMNELVDFIDDRMKKLSSKIVLLKGDFEKKFKNECNLLFERTLSTEANKYIADFLSKRYLDGFKIGLSEFYVVPNKDLFNDNKELIRQVETSNKEVWKFCAFDGFFQVNDFILSGANNVFVEYKVNSKIDYTELATDYLKFKIFTRYYEMNKIFIFIIFNKEYNYPSIKNEENNFCILDKSISKEKIDKSRVYVYVPTDNSKFNEKSIDVYNELLQVSRLSQSIEYDVEKFRYTVREALFIDSLSNFNSNVIKAEYIKDNFNYIEKLWKSVITNFKNDPVYRDWRFDEDTPENIKRILDNSSFHMDNVEQIMHGEDVFDSKRKGLKVHNYSSFNIIVFLDFINRKYKLVSGLLPNYYEEGVGKGKRTKTVDHFEVANDHINKLIKAYDDEKFANNAKKLGFQYLYVLHNVYHIIFDINDDNKVICESEKYQFNQSAIKIKEHYNKIKKILKFDHKVDPLSTEYEARSAELLNYIVKNF